MGFLAKSGLDSLKIAGHKVPIGLLAAGVGVAGLIVVMRARQQGRTVGQVGQAPATAADSGFGLPLGGVDPGVAIAGLSQQLNDLSQSLHPPGPAAPTETLVVTGLYSPAEGTGLRGAPSFESNNPVLNRLGVGQSVQVNPVAVSSGGGETWNQILSGPYAGEWIWTQSAALVPNANAISG